MSDHAPKPPRLHAVTMTDTHQPAQPQCSAGYTCICPELEQVETKFDLRWTRISPAL